jgi:transcriptional regulator with XRE-family HTH domain
MISNLRGERCRQDLSQDELAEKLGVSSASIRQWESGTTRPSASNLLAMSDLFQCSVDYLLGRTDERKGVFTPAL